MNLGTIWSNKPRPPFNQQIQKISVNETKNTKRHVNQASTKSFWGSSVWFLFHTISCRIDNNFYLSNYQYIWGFIKKICYNLPCPLCTKHAIEYINRISINQINTKDKLKNVLFAFHNSVNSRTGKSNASRDVLTKYNRANIKQIFDLFEERYFYSYIGRRHFDDWRKNEIRKEFHTFINVVRNHFI